MTATASFADRQLFTPKPERQVSGNLRSIRERAMTGMGWVADSLVLDVCAMKRDIGPLAVMPYARAQRERPLFARILIVAALLAGPSAALAEPPEKPITGPKLICFGYSTFILADGERVADFGMGQETIGITVNSPSGAFTIVESDIFATPEGAKRLVFSKGTMSVYSFSNHGVSYAIYGPTSFSGGKDRVVLRISGKNFDGNRSVLSRFEVRDPAGLMCDHTFTYSTEL
jgi:hypothetical protein